MTNDAEPNPIRLIVPVPEACKLLGGISQRWLWGATKSGLIPHIRLGRRTMYDIRDLRNFLDSQRNRGSELEQTDAQPGQERADV